MSQKNEAEEVYTFGKYEFNLLKDLKNCIFGNGKMGIKTHIALLQFQVGLLMAGVGWIIILILKGKGA